MKKSIIIGVIIVSIISIMYIATNTMIKKSRGHKNNNPFNIIDTKTKWNGESSQNNDSKFEEFVTLEHGIRAGLLNLWNVYFARGYNIRQLLNKYAPASDNNNTEAYIKAVSGRVGLDPDTIPAKSDYLKIAHAILIHENGYPVVSLEELKQIAISNNLKNYV
jgi:hypothetical protein